MHIMTSLQHGLHDSAGRAKVAARCNRPLASKHASCLRHVSYRFSAFHALKHEARSHPVPLPACRAPSMPPHDPSAAQGAAEVPGPTARPPRGGQPEPPARARHGGPQPRGPARQGRARAAQEGRARAAPPGLQGQPPARVASALAVRLAVAASAQLLHRTPAGAAAARKELSAGARASSVLSSGPLRARCPSARWDVANATLSSPWCHSIASRKQRSHSAEARRACSLGQTRVMMRSASVHTGKMERSAGIVVASVRPYLCLPSPPSQVHGARRTASPGHRTASPHRAASPKREDGRADDRTPQDPPP